MFPLCPDRLFFFVGFVVFFGFFGSGARRDVVSFQDDDGKCSKWLFNIGRRRYVAILRMLSTLVKEKPKTTL